MNGLRLDLALALKLRVAMGRNGWNDKLIAAACKGNKLGQFRQVLLGNARITACHIVDLDRRPFVPEGARIAKHQLGGQFIFDPSRIKLWFADEQKVKYGSLSGDQLRSKVKSRHWAPTSQRSPFS